MRILRMGEGLRSGIYEGSVMHRRLSPSQHAFRYRVFSLLLDLDELPKLGQSRLFTVNRWGLFSFHDKDHGDGRPLREWLKAQLARAGIVADGPVRLLCYPRILGYVFNPLSVWFCHEETGALKAIVYEVHNTYGERHAYVLPADGSKLVRQTCPKDFYVSPFLSGDCSYAFRVRPPADEVLISITEQEQGKPILTALFSGRRKAFSKVNLFSTFLRYPLMTLKVIVAIHFEALRLMRKGIRRHPHASEIQPALETAARDGVRA